ncbi:hypothetical protein B0H17DRAFT_1077139 [Mycena rosella]|uniref:F-box domain-containing protein n=1 Tax=Mycena rosella TaxID=1033263 RepID=A0AAD7GD66_MYCRO|nr:hypothetical protein B0H17DRAFT_1077139 [Mycena rosella]
MGMMRHQLDRHAPASNTRKAASSSTAHPQTRSSRQRVTFSMISPVLLLPPEITSIIFGNCLPSGHRYPSPLNAPLLLTQICRQWREFCLDTPNLWSSIAMADGCGAGCVQLLKQWLSRARNRPLTIAIVLDA